MNTRALALSTAVALAAATLTAATPSSPAMGLSAVPVPAPAPAANAPGRAPARLGAAARPWIAPDAVVTNGYIYDAVRHDGDVVLRGRFTEVGRYSGPALLLDSTNGTRASAPVMDGEISVSVPDGAGGWYVGGFFDKVDASRRQNLLHIGADGSLDPAFDVPVIGYGGVYALQLVDTTLYLSGWFDQVAGATRHNLAAVSTTTNRVTTFAHSTADPVSEIAYAPASGSRDARLYVSSTRGLLALDATTGAPVAGFDAAVAPRRKLEIAVDGDRIYVGGRGIAALDADDGSLDPAFAGGGLVPAPTERPDDAVSTLLVHDGLLYVGGDFASLNGARGPLAAFDLATGAPAESFAPTIGNLGSTYDDRGVFDLSVSSDDAGDSIWVGGRFGVVNGSITHNLALLDATTGDSRPTSIPQPEGPVNAVDVSAAQVLVGGDFTMADATRVHGTARLDGTTLDPMVGGGVAHSRPYGDLVSGGEVVYSFEPYGVGRSVLAFDPATGQTLDARSHALPRLAAATASRTRLYTVQSSEPQERFATQTVSVFSNATGERRATFTLPYQGYVTDVRLDGPDLLISGSFRRGNGTPRPANLAILALDKRTGGVDVDFDPHLNGPVYDLSPAGSPLMAVGLFNRSNPRRPETSQVHRMIARLDPVSGLTSSVFQGAVEYGSETVMEPVDDSTLMYHPRYSIRATYVRFSTGARTDDPTGGYGRFASTFFPLEGGGLGFVANANEYGPQVQYVAAVPSTP